MCLEERLHQTSVYDKYIDFVSVRTDKLKRTWHPRSIFGLYHFLHRQHTPDELAKGLQVDLPPLPETCFNKAAVDAKTLVLGQLRWTQVWGGRSVAREPE